MSEMTWSPAQSADEVLSEFKDVTPVIRRCHNGGWLAVAPDESPIRIGVFAWSAEEAHNRFAMARREWCVLLKAAKNQEPK